MRKRSLVTILFIILITASMIFTGCSSKAPSEPAPAAPPRSDAATEENQSGGTAAASIPAQAMNRKLIVKLSMEMRVDDIEKGILGAEAMAAAAGGYTRESYWNESAGRITLMIPAGNVDTFAKSLGDLGKIINSSRRTDDVTDSYFDTQVHIKNLEAEIGTMRNLLQKQGWKVSEILEIEREIRRLTDELESLKGYITNLDRQIAYSEVGISFEKSQVSIDSVSQDSLAYKLQVALKNGVDFLVNVITAILSLIAFVLPILPLAAVVYFIMRKPIRSFRKKDNQDPKQ